MSTDLKLKLRHLMFFFPITRLNNVSICCLAEVESKVSTSAPSLVAKYD